MHTCPKCNKEFGSARSLAGHMRIHSNKNPKKRRYKNSKVRDGICINCNKEFEYSLSNSTGKFCSNKCCGEHRIKESMRNVEETGTGNLKRYHLNKYGNVCSECGITEWNDKPLTMHLDHIDGNSDNHTLDNTRLLCPNCHSQTDTYGFTGVVKETKRNSYLRKYKSGDSE